MIASGCRLHDRISVTKAGARHHNPPSFSHKLMHALDVTWSGWSSSAYTLLSNVNASPGCSLFPTALIKELYVITSGCRLHDRISVAKAMARHHPAAFQHALMHALYVTWSGWSSSSCILLSVANASYSYGPFSGCTVQGTVRDNGWLQAARAHLVHQSKGSTPSRSTRACTDARIARHAVRPELLRLHSLEQNQCLI